jgi:hypothetical protein
MREAADDVEQADHRQRPGADSAAAAGATTPGRCVAMKATWKPQTKKPAHSSR